MRSVHASLSQPGSVLSLQWLLRAFVLVCEQRDKKYRRPQSEKESTGAILSQNELGATHSSPNSQQNPMAIKNNNPENTLHPPKKKRKHRGHPQCPPTVPMLAGTAGTDLVLDFSRKVARISIVQDLRMAPVDRWQYGWYF